MEIGFKCMALTLLMVILPRVATGKISCYRCEEKVNAELKPGEPEHGDQCWTGEFGEKNKGVCDEEYDLCYKMAVNYGDMPRTIQRGCTAMRAEKGALPDMHVPINKCRTTEPEPMYQGLSSTFCWCDTDFCNLGHHPHISFTAVVVPVMAIGFVLANYFGGY